VPFCHGTLHINGAAIALIIWASLFYWATKAFILPYIGDAGRYMDPAPNNIDKRQIIREEGVNLLKKIHESDNEYKSVIIVAHSLGSVIAYDLIKFLWNEYHEPADPNKLLALDDKTRDEWIEKLESAEQIGQKIGKSTSCKDYQEAQQTCFEYLKIIGNKWLITDFVTMGSPLTHAGHFIVQQDDLFQHLKEQREYPTCPPTLDEHKKNNLWQAKNIKFDGFEQTFDYTHYNHSSPFAVTRWTNYYFSTDFLGGPLAEKFGLGIKDVRLPNCNLLKFYPKGHNDYWNIH
jgi:hypothetical protein